MNNQEYLSEILGKINWILEKYDAILKCFILLVIEAWNPNPSRVS